MERLKQIFNDRFDINNINMSKTQQETVITVWAEHFNKQRPTTVCLGTFRNICRSLHNDYKLFLANKPTLAEKLEVLETAPEVETETLEVELKKLKTPKKFKK